MKKIYLMVMAAVCAMLLFHSCSIEKRRYLPGYHIEWKHRVKTSPVSASDPITVKGKESTVQSTGESHITPTEKPGPIATGKPVSNQNDQALTTTETNKKVTTQSKNNLLRSFLVLQAEKKDHLDKAVLKKNLPLTVIHDTQSAISDDGRLIFAIIFLLLGLSPFAVLVYVGRGSEFNLDLIVWLGGIVLLMLGFIVDSVFLVYAGWIFLLAAWVYAIVVMARRV